MDRETDGEAEVRRRDLLDDHQVRDVRLAPSAVLLGIRKAREAELGKLRVERSGILGTFFVLGRGRTQVGGGELARETDQRALVFVEEPQVLRHVRENTVFETRGESHVRIEDQKGDPIKETTVVVDDEELLDLLQGLADVVEGKREHLHFQQLGGPELVVRRTEEADADPLRKSMDWWVGPLILVGVLLIVIGAATLVRWMSGLL